MRNPLTKKAFTEWVEKQPERRKYDFEASYGCAFNQYLASIGISNACVVYREWRQRGEWRPIPKGCPDAIMAGPHTFGALATRLRS